MRITVQNSFCLAKEVPSEIGEFLTELLTYRNDIDAEFHALVNRRKYFRKELNRIKDSDDVKKIKAVEKKINDVSFLIKKLKDNEYVCWYKQGAFPTGLLNIVKAGLDKKKVAYTLEDLRVVPKSNVLLPWRNPIPPFRYYQDKAVEEALTQGRGVTEAAVGSGKSFIMMQLIKSIAVRSLVVVPSRGLAQQLHEDMKIHFGRDKVEIITTDKIRKAAKLKPIRIVVINTLDSLRRSGEIENLIADVDALFVDEIHHAAAGSYIKLLPLFNSIYYRFGFTGTFLRNDAKILDLWGFLSNVTYRYPAKKAIADGYLTPCTVFMYRMQGKRANRWQKEYDKNYCGNQDLLRRIKDICVDNPGQQILILVNKKDKSGLLIHEFLKAHRIENTYVSGDAKKDEIEGAITDFNAKKINVMIGTNILGEGRDIRSTDHLIQAQGGKSEIVIVQAVGRGIRLCEGKDHAYIHDFYFEGTKYQEKHADQRIDIYERNFGCDIEWL